MKSRELLRILVRAGWYIVRQHGSHVIMRHLINDNQIIVQMHGSKDIHEGLVKKILKQAGLNKKGEPDEKN